MHQRWKRISGPISADTVRISISLPPGVAITATASRLVCPGDIQIYSHSKAATAASSAVSHAPMMAAPSPLDSVDFRSIQPRNSVPVVDPESSRIAALPFDLGLQMPGELTALFRILSKNGLKFRCSGRPSPPRGSPIQRPTALSIPPAILRRRNLAPSPQTTAASDDPLPAEAYVPGTPAQAVVSSMKHIARVISLRSYG